MASHSKNLIPLDNVVHGSDGISHFIDENNLPSEITTRLTNAVVNNAVKKRLDEEIPKAISIRDAENYKIREEEKKSFSIKVNDLKVQVGKLEQEKEINKRENEIKINQLITDVEKENLQKAKTEEQKYREIINTINLKNSDEIHKRDKEIQEKNHLIESIEKDYAIQSMNQIQTIKEESLNQIQEYKNKISILEIDNINLKKYRSGHSKIGGNNGEDFVENTAAYHINMGFPGSIEKDTNPVKGEMLDFIWKSYDKKGNEVLNAGIEVKTESLDSSYTQKNIKAYPKLERNCNDKGLKYKILVSTREPGNKIFDDGIYRVPNYKNMYVCRPQHLMAFLGLLTDQAVERYQDLETIKQAKESNFQVEVIQENMSTFRLNFLKEIRDWEGSYDSALKLIETIMQKLNKLKLELLNGRNSIKYLTDKVEDFNIKKLTSSGKLLQSSQAGNK